MTSVSLSMNTSLRKTSGPFEFPEVAGLGPRGVSTKWPCTSKMNSSRAGPVCTRASWRSSAASRGTSKKPPVLPAAALALLNASKLLAAPQDETRNCLRVNPSLLEKREARSCASRLAARLTLESGTGTNSPFEVLSSLIGRRLPSGSMAGPRERDIRPPYAQSITLRLQKSLRRSKTFLSQSGGWPYLAGRARPGEAHENRIAG